MITSFSIHNMAMRSVPLKTIVPDHSLTDTTVRYHHMPAQPTWFHQLDEILETLREMESSHLDRLAIQEVFGVRERRARQIMAGLPGVRAGNAAAVLRTALIARLEEVKSGRAFQWEAKRRARVVEELDRTRRHITARRVRIAAPSDVRERRLENVSTDITLRPGELHIKFYGAEDLAAKMFELSQAMTNDWPAFVRAVEGPRRQGC